MDVGPGYKHTDVGVIPKGWNVAALESLGRHGRPAIKAGPFGSSLTKATYVKEGYKVYGQEQVIRGDHLYGDYYISKSKFNDLRSCSVEADDILLSLVGTAGRVLVIPHGAPEGIINPRLIRFSFDRKAIVPSFFRFLFETASYQSLLARTAQGGTMGVLNAGLLRPILIPLPSLPEQETIAEALSDVDALIESLEQLLAKKHQIKQGAMQELLTGRKRLPGFCGEWQVRRLGDCFALVSKRNTELNDNVVTMSAQQGFVRQEEFFKKRVASSVLENYYLIERGHFAYNRSYSNGYPFGAIKRLARYEKGVVTTLYICFALKPEAECDATFFEHYFEAGLLNSGLSTVTNEGGRAHGLLNITKADFFSREVQRPPLSEQIAIAAILSDMDAEIAVLETRLTKARELKQGMMQELLTGRIRLI